MNRSKHTRIAKLIVVIGVFQLFLVSGEFLLNLYPLWFGKEIRLAIQPVDPRSLLRGQYVALRYPITRVSPHKLESEGASLRPGDPIYVSLQETKNGWIGGNASINPPAEGDFIRGRVSWRGNRWRKEVVVHYGIEAYFANPERALEIERSVRSRDSRYRFARIKLSSDGKAVLVGLARDANGDESRFR